MARSSRGESSLSRVVHILEAFDTATRDLSATQIAERAGMPLSTAHRLLQELVATGLIERVATRRYRIGLRLWELAVRTPGSLGIREIAMPILREAHSKLGQNLQLGVLQDSDVLYLERLSAPRAAVNFVVVGGRLPFHATSSGLVLAAFSSDATRERLLAKPLRRYALAPRPDRVQLEEELARIRARGSATTRGYLDPAATAIAVPVMGPLSGAAIAAISAIVPTDDPRESGVLSVLIPAAASLTRSLIRHYEDI